MDYKNIILIVVIFLGLAGYGYFNAVAGPKNGETNNPQIIIEPKNFDFGAIDYGSVVEHKFQLRNSGKKELNIRRIATSCGCTTAKVDKNNLAPEEETILTVIYNTGAMGDSPHAKGQQERIIYVQSDDPVSPQTEITIQAYVN